MFSFLVSISACAPRGFFRLVALSLALALSPGRLLAQSVVRGSVAAADDGSAIPGASVVVFEGDKAVSGVPSAPDGSFSVDSLPAGRYSLRVSFVGFQPFVHNFSLADNAQYDAGCLRLKSVGREISEVTVVHSVQRQEQRGDTVVFNSAAFKVHPDATTEDLLRKMPGMQVDGGKVSHGGEVVKKILVDGKEFFGSDPSAALKNIDANMVEKIEVFDKMSEQAEFTGVSDGNEEKTINIMTKADFRVGSFWRAYAGGGSDKHYEAGATANFSAGSHGLFVSASINDVNMSGFSMPDEAATQSQGGLNTTGAFGVNYRYESAGGFAATGSYVFSHQDNKVSSSVLQDYFQAEGAADSLRSYQSGSDSHRRSNGHRVSLRLKWGAGRYDSFIFAPNWSWQGGEQSRESSGVDMWGASAYRSTRQVSSSHSSSWSLGGNLTWRHKFQLPRRTVSLGVKVSGKRSSSDGSSRSLQAFCDSVPQLDWPDADGQSDALSADVTAGPDPLASESPGARLASVSGQCSDSRGRSFSFSARAVYTEPLGEYLAALVNYAPSCSFSSNDKFVSVDSSGVFDSQGEGEFAFSPRLSNSNESRYIVHRAGVALRASKAKAFKAAIGLDAQNALLSGRQTFPSEFSTRYAFFSLMPSAEFSLSADKSLAIRLRYRTSSSAPSISQLQDVVDVSDVRCFTAGNPDLNQATTHQLYLLFSANDHSASRHFSISSRTSFVSDAVVSSTLIASADSILPGGILLPAGTQFSKPVNLDGSVTASVNATFSSPIKRVGCNASLSLGANLQRSPGLYDGCKVFSRSYSFSAGAVVGSSFSENADFNVAYQPSYNVVSRSLASSAGYNYYRHSLRADLNLLFFSRHLVFATSAVHNFSSGMGGGFDDNYVLWNAAAAFKFLSRRQAEVRLRVNDILDRGRSSSRSVQEAYVSTSSSNSLRRYAMLTFSYKFKGASSSSQGSGRGGDERPSGRHFPADGLGHTPPPGR